MCPFKQWVSGCYNKWQPWNYEASGGTEEPINNQKQNKPQQTTTTKKHKKNKHNKPTALCKEKTLKELDPTSKIQTKFRQVFIGSRPTSIQPSHPTSAGCASHFGHGPKTRQSWRCASTTGPSRNLGKKLYHPGDQNSIKPYKAPMVERKVFKSSSGSSRPTLSFFGQKLCLNVLQL